MTAVPEIIQQFDAGKQVVLYQLDLSPIEGGIAHFANEPMPDGTPISWGEQEYAPIPIEMDDITHRQGAQDRPKLRVGNANNALTPARIALRDLVGGQITRIRTFERFLDGGSEPGAFYRSREVYSIDRMVQDNGVFIEWELAAISDQQGLKIPARPMFKDYCTYKYRRWDAANELFVYARHCACPYTADEYFDINGNPTDDPAEDDCSKRLQTGCEPRYPEPEIVPFQGFPGIAEVQAR